jgi:arylsulfatase A-like enzyme
MFRQAGYATHIVGKWHNDRASLNRAFTGGSRVFLGGMADHTRIGLQEFDPTGAYAKTNERVATGFSSELFAEAAIDFLKGRDKAQPFFLYTAFTAPHDPRTPPQEFLDRYPVAKIRLPRNFQPRHPFDNGEMEVRDEKLLPWPRKPEAVRAELAAYYAMITHLDAQLGRILDALEATGAARNTIIVFAGDNGLAVGQHGLLGKQNLYEHSVRVPLVISGPGVPAGKRRDALCYLLDLFPTLGELANLPVPAGLDGRSLVPVIQGETTQARGHVFAAYRDVQRMVRDDRWKLIHYPKIDRWQLFDLRNDPLERHDLSGETRQPERIGSLRDRLAEWEKSRGNPLAPP